MKTDARRQAIIAAAWDVFRAKGFERTTMSDISERLGGSKATLYGYFKTKEELFAVVLEQRLEEMAEEAFRHISGKGALDMRLLDFARFYLHARLSPEMIDLERAMITLADRSDLGLLLHRRLIAPHWRRLASVMEEEMAAERLRRADPYTTAMHLRGLIEVDTLERRLHGDPSVSPEEVAAAADEGVAVFMRAYAMERADA
jgi:AcrR family transcriptional regulator